MKMQIAACPGMSFYKNAAVAAWGLEEYSSPLDPTLFLGMYFKEDVMRLKETTGDKYVFWNGSDVSRTLASPEWHQPILKANAVHACHNKALADELATIGIKAEVSPTLFANPKFYSRADYVPSTRPTLYMTVHPGREEEYGMSMAIDIMRYASADLYIYGTRGNGRLGNVYFRQWISEQAWEVETRSMHGALRLNKHDGTSQIVIKAILRGHYAVVTHDPWEAFKGVVDLATEGRPNNGVIPNLNGWIDRVLEKYK